MGAVPRHMLVILIGEIAHFRRRTSRPKRTRRHSFMRCHKRAARDHALALHNGAIEDHGPHPDKTTGVDVAGMQDRRMPDRHVLANMGAFEIMGTMDHGQILHIRPRPYDDITDIAAQDATVPYACLCPDRHIPDDDGIFRDKGGWVDDGKLVAVGSDDSHTPEVAQARPIKKPPERRPFRKEDNSLINAWPIVWNDALCADRPFYARPRAHHGSEDRQPSEPSAS